MKKKKNGQRTFRQVVIRDIVQLFYIVFLSIPKAAIKSLRSISWVSLKDMMNDGEDGTIITGGIVIVSYVVSVFSLAFILQYIPVYIGLPVSCLLPLLFIYTIMRFIWYKADLEKEAYNTYLKNIAENDFIDDVIDLDDLPQEAQDDFYNTVSGSGG